MLEDLLNYQQNLTRKLKSSSVKINWPQELETFQIKFGHLQHERLIHLIVTLTVGMAALISCLISVLTQSALLFILDLILIILFFAYILHYRKLENTAQSWYTLLNQIINRLQ